MPRPKYRNPEGAPTRRYPVKLSADLYAEADRVARFYGCTLQDLLADAIYQRIQEEEESHGSALASIPLRER